MSDNIYNILNNFNKVAQEPKKPATQTQPKAKSQLQESMDQVLSEKYMGFKKTVAAVKKGGSAENPEAVAAAIGRKKYGKEKFQKAAAAGKKLGEASKPDYIDLDKDGNKAEPMKKAAKDAKSKKVQEVAPPGAKAERMVKHIKKGYAKDGKLTKTEKSKAYGAAWKAHNKGKIEETIKAMYEAGFSKEQIIEGWDDMMKAVEKRSKDKGTGKFDKKQISTGTVYTRKYDPKTGETDDSENVTAVKRGRGRPKKSTFESATTANKMIAEHFREFIEGSIQGGVWTSNPPKKGQPNVPVPQNIDGGSVSPAPKAPTPKPSTPPMGSIKGGVWTAEPPKPGEKGVPVPQNPEVAKEGEMADAMASAANNLANRLGDKGRAGASVANNLTNNLANRLGDKVRAGASVANNLTNRLSDKDKSQDNPNTDGYDLEVAKEGDMEEGNAFGGAVAKAKADGVQPGETIKVGGKTYPVKEGEELLQMLRIAGIKVLEDTQLDECGMSSMGNGMMGQHEQEGRMNVSTNMSSDGNKSVTITADGNSALELMQMLKLAGMGGGEESHAHDAPEGVMVVSTEEDEVEENLEVRANPAGASSAEQAKKIGAQFPQQNGKEPNLAYKIGEEEVEEAKDERYHASTTPDEHVMPVQVQTKGGDGDVAGKEKKMTPNGYQFGDNPRAMKESMSLKLMKEYETIKVKK